MLVREKRTRSFNELAQLSDTADLYAGVNGRLGSKRRSSSIDRPVGIAPRQSREVRLDRSMSPSVASTASDVSEAADTPAADVAENCAAPLDLLSAWAAPMPTWITNINSPKSRGESLVPPANLSPLISAIPEILGPPPRTPGLHAHDAAARTTAPAHLSLGEQALLWRIRDLDLSDTTLEATDH